MQFRFHFYSRSDAKKMADCIYQALRDTCSDQIPYIMADLVECDYMNGSMNFTFGHDEPVQEVF